MNNSKNRGNNPKNRRHLLTGVAVAAMMAAGVVQASAQGEWSGFYFGGHIGGAFANIDGQFFPSESPDPWDDDTAFVGGAHAGYNWQTDGFVWGLEADVSATDISTKGLHTHGGVTHSEEGTAEIDMLASLRLRLGMPMDMNLFYVTGGVAWRTGDWAATFNPACCGAGPSSGLSTGGDTDLDEVGGVVGLGWERRVNETFSARLEALWYIFDESKTPGDCCAGAVGAGSVFESDPLVIRLGGSFHFN
jgi:outer membrane immunogenic protein